MNFSQTIRERRSIRKCNTLSVPQELVVSLLNQAGDLYEPEGTPRWRCLYAGTPESRERLADCMLAKTKESRLGRLIPSKMMDLFVKRLTDIPAHLIVVAESGADRRQSDENFAAACSVMQNFQLLAWEHGLGMLWDTEPIVQNEMFFSGIGLQEGERLVGILHMGYFDKTPKSRRRTAVEQKWTVIRGNEEPHGLQPHTAPLISEQSILEVLNDAVWAPNDGLREPWRFILVTDGEIAGDPQAAFSGAAQAYLLVVATEEADPHKREEDYAAVCCLIQNFLLLAKSKNWGVLRTRPEWIYDPERCRLFGVRPLERIAAVLELGRNESPPQAAAACPIEIQFELLGSRS